MSAPPKEIEFPRVPLKHCTTEEHCASLRAAGALPFWWYQDFGRSGRNSSLPFQDNLGHWWYQVRPGFAWPVNAFEVISSRGLRLPFRKTYLAYQHIVPQDEASNSMLVINTITDLAAYGSQSIDDKRRNAIRKGYRSCDVHVVDRVDDAWLHGAVKAWNDLVDRTGWRNRRDPAMLQSSWTRLLELPAATILLAIDKASGQVAGFLITKIYGQTAYVDTIASNSDLLKSNPNDLLMYTFIRNAQQLLSVNIMHYAIKSNVDPLEQFKRSLGFAHCSFPAVLRTRPGLLTALRLVYPGMYKRLTGRL
ncbi:MAG: hypothetical protein V2A79_01870 [Planctomycetota bacterium]